MRLVAPRKNNALRYTLFRDITRLRVVISYRRFGTTYRSDIHVTRRPSKVQVVILDPCRCDRSVVPKRRYGITALERAIFQNIVDLLYSAAEASNHESHNPPASRPQPGRYIGFSPSEPSILNEQL